MTICRLSEVPITPSATVFRPRPSIILLSILPIFTVAILAAAIHSYFAHESLYVVAAGFILATSLGILSFLGFRNYKFTRKPSSWIIALDGKRLLLRFVSHGDPRFNDADFQIVLMPFEHIEWARRAMKLKPMAEGLEYDQYLDIATKNLDLMPLQVELGKELQSAASIRRPPLRDYAPLQIVEDSVLRVCWPGSTKPKLARALQLLVSHVAVLPSVTVPEEQRTDEPFKTWSV